METPILVTGALGNVGAEVVKRLQAEGIKVRAADIDQEKLNERFDHSVESIRFDFSDPGTYAKTFEGGWRRCF